MQDDDDRKGRVIQTPSWNGAGLQVTGGTVPKYPLVLSCSSSVDEPLLPQPSFLGKKEPWGPRSFPCPSSSHSGRNILIDLGDSVELIPFCPSIHTGCKLAWALAIRQRFSDLIGTLLFTTAAVIICAKIFVLWEYWSVANEPLRAFNSTLERLCYRSQPINFVQTSHQASRSPQGRVDSRYLVLRREQLLCPIIRARVKWARNRCAGPELSCVLTPCTVLKPLDTIVASCRFGLIRSPKLPLRQPLC